VPADLDIHLVLDNYATHKTPPVKGWLARHPRYHLHFTPTSASWLNLVERWFALLAEKQIKRGVHRSVRQLKAAIAAFIPAHNDDPEPFIWTKSADAILTRHRPILLRHLRRSCRDLFNESLIRDTTRLLKSRLPISRVVIPWDGVRGSDLGKDGELIHWTP
jgi:DDE superfamily endonuclease